MGSCSLENTKPFRVHSFFGLNEGRKWIITENIKNLLTLPWKAACSLLGVVPSHLYSSLYLISLIHSLVQAPLWHDLHTSPFSWSPNFRKPNTHCTFPQEKGHGLTWFGGGQSGVRKITKMVLDEEKVWSVCSSPDKPEAREVKQLAWSSTATEPQNLDQMKPPG